MKNFFGFIVLVKLLLVLFISNSYAVLGAATIYKVTMKKVELCTASTAVTDCQNAVVIGSGVKEVDIAAVTAGSAAATYGDPAMLELGVTYTHVRVTIDRGFSLKSATIDTTESGDTDDCKTIASTDTMYGTTRESRKYTHVPVIAEGGTNAEMNLYMPSDNYSRCLNETCGSTNDDIDMTYGTKYAAYQEQHAEGDETTEHQLVYALSSAYTVSMQPPIVDISFGTLEAVGIYEVNSLCQIWAEEPVVSVSIQ